MMIPRVVSENSIRFILIITITIDLSAGYCIAGGPIHGAKAAGMGTAFVGLADDPSAILHNPAGIAGLQGVQVYSGVTLVAPSTSFTNQNGETENTENTYFFPPHAYLSWKPESTDLAFGIGVFSPFGIGGRQWPDDGLTRFLSVESFVATLSVNPTIAWKITPKVSMALGGYYLYARNEAENLVDQSLLGAGDGRFQLESDGGSYGYNFGFLFQPSDLLRLGIAYRSSVDVDLKGDAKLSRIAPALQPIFGGSTYKTGVKSQVKLPQIVSLGVGFFPNQKLTIAVDVEWVEWSRYGRTTLDFQNEIPSAGFRDTSLDNDWNSTWLYKAGIEYLICDQVALRAGYAFVESPVPDSSLSPATPEADQHNISIGLGYRYGNYWIDAFYLLALYEDRTVENSILSGKYENLTNYFGVSFGCSF
jgi:long-chain fatty acid transport protein